MDQSIIELSNRIKEKAFELGFSACGISAAEYVGEKTDMAYQQWLENGFHASLDYMARNIDKRLNPLSLVENAKSVVSVALSYYPERKLPEYVPQFAYYAYGKDYHEVVKTKLNLLFDYVKGLYPDVSGRCFCDSAPVLETYWAMRAGIGYKGRNTLLIIPRKGSFFFLGELILDKELCYDRPVKKISCGRCNKCIVSCPTGALQENGYLDSSKCISYHTIESKSDTMDADIASRLNNRVYGCDICQQVCPWNRFSIPHSIPEFFPSEEFLELTAEKLHSMPEEDFRRIFRHSAVKRAKYNGLKRNIQALDSLVDESLSPRFELK